MKNIFKKKKTPTKFRKEIYRLTITYSQNGKYYFHHVNFSDRIAWDDMLFHSVEGKTMAKIFGKNVLVLKDAEHRIARYLDDVLSRRCNVIVYDAESLDKVFLLPENIIDVKWRLFETKTEEWLLTPKEHKLILIPEERIIS